MIAKIITGKSFGGAVRYLLEKGEDARLLDSDGVDMKSLKAITESFNFQRKARPENSRVVGHISLSFHRDDTPKLTDDFMRQLAGEYLRRMHITGTQYIVVPHTDTQHPHLHILYNRVRYDAKLVRSHNERIRSVAVCKAMKKEYGLTFSEGKQDVKVEKLHGPDQPKYAIYEAIKEALPRCLSLTELAEALQRQGIVTTFVHRGGDPEKEVQGLTFTMNGQILKASQVDRKFSYGNLCKTIEASRVERERQQAEQAKRQRQGQAVHCPVIFGLQLTSEQVREIKDGQPVYLQGMRHEGRTFDGYLVMDDKLERGWAYLRDPREWVKYGMYAMRRMDRDLIEQGYLVRALVRWGEAGQTARPYLWKESPTAAGYKESWSDPRKPSPKAKHVPSLKSRLKKSRGI